MRARGLQRKIRAELSVALHFVERFWLAGPNPSLRADAAGLKLGKAIYINENSSVPGPIYRDVAAKAAGAPAAVETAISPGEMDVTVNVQINYDID